MSMRLTSKGAQRWIDGAIAATQAERFGDAGEKLLHALEAIERHPDAAARARELGLLADLCSEAGHPDLALMALHGALESGERDDRPERYCADLLTLANSWQRLERPAAAASVNAAALSYAVQHGRFADAASASTNLAIIAANEGRLPDALPRLQQSLEFLGRDSQPDTDAITRLALIQVVDALQADPGIALDAAGDLFTRLEPHVGAARWTPIAPAFQRLVARYTAAHPELDADAWKRERFPLVFGRPRQ
jgi:tetratricopeptide (TPR) repeat protein